ncbi:hypothetical protein SK128_010079 [Halocaridina rubra]|uniref:CO dehydrogenase flavoprotein C-terminal domain-containing protein n=1 Tax=Halocaridina rubra TaxID=373956 RepID=A0AAN8WUW8_HALRR
MTDIAHFRHQLHGLALNIFQLIFKELTGKSWNSSLLERGMSLLLEDLPLSPSAPGGMTEYRRTVAVRYSNK